MNAELSTLRSRRVVLAVLLAAALSAPRVRADPRSRPALLEALRHGGVVILMRHASSPRKPPDAAQADPENASRERQLDESGRASARTFGDALRRLRIPIGEILSSPTYRARETLELAGLKPIRSIEQLGDQGHSMQGDASGTRGAWLRAQAATVPKPGTNTLIVTHFPNIREAFPAPSDGLGDGEALILRPDGHGGTSVVARVPIEEWPKLVSP